MCSKGRIFAAVLASCLFLSGCASEEAGQAMLLTQRARAEGETSTAEAAIGTIEREVYQSASVYNPSMETVTCGDLAGATFVKMLVSKWDTVREGDPIAEFTVTWSEAERSGLYADQEIASLQYESSLSQYAAAVRSAESDLASKKAGTPEYELARIALERAQSSYDHFVTTGSQSLAEIAEKIEKFEKKIQTTTVNAPTDGVVADVQIVSKNAPVAASTELCTLAKADATYLAVSSADGAMVRWGSEVSISNKLLDAPVSGHVVYAPDVEGKTSGTALVAIDDLSVLDKIINNLATNYVTASYTLEGVLIVPTDAVTEEEDGYYIKENGYEKFVTTGKGYYVTVLENGDVKKRYVSIGISGRDPETGEGVVQILEGLHAGDSVILR